MKFLSVHTLGHRSLLKKNICCRFLCSLEHFRPVLSATSINHKFWMPKIILIKIKLNRQIFEM